MKSLSIVILSLLVSYVFGFSNYPATCIPSGMGTGGHTVPTAPDAAGQITLANANGVALTKYVGGGTHTITFTTANTLGGFLFWAANATGTYVGSWVPAAGQTTTGAISGMLQSGATVCPGSTALGHSTTLSTTTVAGTWVANGAATGPLTFNFVSVNKGNRATCTINSVTFAQQPGTVTPPAPTAAPTTAPAGTPAGTPGGNTPATPGAPITPGQQVAAAAGTQTALSTGAIVGIVVGSIVGVVLIAAIVFPIVFAIVRKDDPRVKRLTGRLTNGFGRGQ